MAILTPQGGVVYYTGNGDWDNDPAFMAEISRMPEGGTVSMRIADKSGKTHLMLADRSKVTGFILVDCIPLNDLAPDTKRILRVTEIVALITTVLAAVIGLGVARSTTRPLTALSSLMERAEGGDLTVRSRYRSPDEIGRVSECFDHLMDRMEQLVEQTAVTAKLEASVRIERRLRERNEDLRHAIAALSASLDLRQVLLLTLEHIGRFSQFERASIWIADQGQLQCKACVGKKKGLGGIVLMLSELPDPERLYRDRTPQVWRTYRIPRTKQVLSQAYAIPLIVQNDLIGLILLEDRRLCDNDADAEPLLMLAGQVAMALQNAQLFERMTQMATVDGLTGLYNRRHFMQLAELEIQRVIRYEPPLCIIMFDIDHFKYVNDEYGHDIGDRVLQAVSMLVRRSLRSVDIAGRYGGEEFVALLPETGIEGAAATAERIRQGIERLEVRTARSNLKITASFGVARLNPGTSDMKSLLKQADIALYQAKELGRNRVCVYGDESSGA